MKILYFLKNNKLSPGILCEKGVLDIDAFQEFNGSPLFLNRSLNLDDLKLIKELIAKENIQPRWNLWKKKKQRMK